MGDLFEPQFNNSFIAESETDYLLLFQHMSDGYAYCKMIFDESGQPVDFVYISVNDAFEKHTGLKKENVIGRRVTEVIPGVNEQNPEIVQTYGEVVKTGKPVEFETFFRPLGMWLKISVYTPRKGYFAAVFENITERKHIEEALRDSEAKYRSIVETAAEGIILFRADGTISYANNQMAELLGCSKDKLVGKIGASFMRNAEPAPQMRKLLGKGQVLTEEFEIIRSDGEKRWMRANASPIFDEQGEQIGNFGMFTDITGDKKAEEAVKASEIRYIGCYHRQNR